MKKKEIYKEKKLKQTNKKKQKEKEGMKRRHLIEANTLSNLSGLTSIKI